MKLSDIMDYGGNPIHLHRFYRMDCGKLSYIEGFKPFTAEDETEAGTLFVRSPGEGNHLVGDVNVLNQTFGCRSMHLSNTSLLLTLAIPDKHEEAV